LFVMLPRVLMGRGVRVLVPARRLLRPKAFRGLATAAETPKGEESPAFARYLAGVVGLCVLQRLIPTSKPEPTIPKRVKHHTDATPSQSIVVRAIGSDSPDPPLQAAPEPTEAVAPPAEPAVPHSPPTSTMAMAAHEASLRTAGKHVLGSSGPWYIYEEGSALFASSASATSAPPLRITPSGLQVGAVIIGSGDLLVELEGAGTDPSTLYRIRLPSDDTALQYGDSLDPIPDTLSPAGVASPPGVVLSWITDGHPVAVRGALTHGDGSVSLALRAQERPRLGPPAWVETCKRLNLPPPPVDPNGPTLFSEWMNVATWEGAAPDSVTLLGFSNETAWVHDGNARMIVGFSVDGERTELPLR
jgi:hypothetical protein